MGSRISACTSPKSVAIKEIMPSETNVSAHNTRVYSDSGDSGISVSEDISRVLPAYPVQINPFTNHVALQYNNDDSISVEGNDVACGPDVASPITPRPAAAKHPRTREVSDTRNVVGNEKVKQGNFANSKLTNPITTLVSKSKRSSICGEVPSTRNLTEFAGKNKQICANYKYDSNEKSRKHKPSTRPKSAYCQKSGDQLLFVRSVMSTAPTTECVTSQVSSSESGSSQSEQSMDLSSAVAQSSKTNMMLVRDEFHKNIDLTEIRNPSNAHRHKRRGHLSRSRRPSITNCPKEICNSNEQCTKEFYDNEDISATTTKLMVSDCDEDAVERPTLGRCCSEKKSTYRGHSNFKPASNDKYQIEFYCNSSAKKRNSNSIASILRNTFEDFHCAMRGQPSSVDNTSHFSGTQSKIQNHVIKCLQEIRRELLNISLTFVYNGLMSNQSICDAIKSIRHRFLRIIGDYKMASGQPVARLAFGSNDAVKLEVLFSEHLTTISRDHSKLTNIWPLIIQHLIDLESLCDEEACDDAAGWMRITDHPNACMKCVCIHNFSQLNEVDVNNYKTVDSLVEVITKESLTNTSKAHALYYWLTSQTLGKNFRTMSDTVNSPTALLQQLAENMSTYASVYQKLARSAGLKCKVIEGYVKGSNYPPGTVIDQVASVPQQSWNVVLLNGQYHFIDSAFGAKQCKFSKQHFFMTPPEEVRLSHFSFDHRWQRVTYSGSMDEFVGSLKTWPAMFAFDIRPLTTHAVLTTTDGSLSVTVILRNVAVTPQLEYIGPGVAQDAYALSSNIDQEISSKDNAEMFHLNLYHKGTYYFTLLVHNREDDNDIPALQYRIQFNDEIL